VNWQFGGLAWKPTPGSRNTEDLWAPDVFTGDDGKFYMYGSANTHIGVAVAASPRGPFIEVYDHPLIGAAYGGIGDGIFFDTKVLDFEESAIDTHLFKGSDGSLTMYYSRNVPWYIVEAVPMKDYATLEEEKATIVLDGQTLKTSSPTSFSKLLVP